VTRDHARFLVSGILFGFLSGYVVAYGILVPRVKQEAAPVPAAGNLGMSGAVIGSEGGAPQGQDAGGGAQAAGAPGGGDRQAVMEQVFEQVKALKQALEKNPKDPEALVRLANFFQDAGKFDQAVEYYKRALAERPADVASRTDMGICLREMGRPDEAIQEFRNSLQTDPKHWQSWLNLGIVSLYDKHDTATAASAFGKVEELNPSFEGLPQLKEAVRQARGSS
jgi:predicted Zn-dependent protease